MTLARIPEVSKAPGGEDYESNGPKRNVGYMQGRKASSSCGRAAKLSWNVTLCVIYSSQLANRSRCHTAGVSCFVSNPLSGLLEAIALPRARFPQISAKPRGGLQVQVCLFDSFYHFTLSAVRRLHFSSATK